MNGLFFAVSIFGDFREVANLVKIKHTRKIPDVRYIIFLYFISDSSSRCILCFWNKQISPQVSDLLKYIKLFNTLNVFVIFEKV